MEINVTVMTSTFWPTTNSGATCNFPPELLQACGSFENFYNTRHSGRRLTWQPALGSADLKVQFKAKRHDLNVSTFALVILLLFKDIADDDFLTYEVQLSISMPLLSLIGLYLTGYQNLYCYSGWRSTEKFTIFGVWKIQNS